MPYRPWAVAIAEPARLPSSRPVLIAPGRARTSATARTAGSARTPVAAQLMARHSGSALADGFTAESPIVPPRAQYRCGTR